MARKTYVIGGKPFRTKKDITSYCQSIIFQTADSEIVEGQHMPFLLGLFSHHENWAEKSKGGVDYFTVQTTIYGSRGFVIGRHGHGLIDISYMHAVKQIGDYRKGFLLPQKLLDFKKAARDAIRPQIVKFKKEIFYAGMVCPLSKARLRFQTSVVDHVPPKTFDSLLFDFCKLRSLNPCNIEITSPDGVVNMFLDAGLMEDWRRYHLENAELRILYKIENLRLPKQLIRWDELYG